MHALAYWRDAGLVLLAFEVFLLGLPIGVALYYSLRSLRQAQVWILPRLYILRSYAKQTRDISGRIASGVAAPFVLLQGVMAGVQRALQVLGRR